MVTGNDFTNSTTPIVWAGLPSASANLVISGNKGLDDIQGSSITPAASITLGFPPVVRTSAGATTITTMLNSWANRQVIIEPTGTTNFGTGGNICNAMATALPIIATWTAGASCWLLK
jgi:hypothetical protein